MTSSGDLADRMTHRDSVAAENTLIAGQRTAFAPGARPTNAATTESPLLSDAYSRGVNPSASATLNAQFWFERFPWRPTAAWSVVAGLLTLAYFQSARGVIGGGAGGVLGATGAIDWRGIVLLLLLVDPLWGSLWRLAWGRDELLPLRQQVMGQRFWLPYLSADSPAAHIMGVGAEPQAGASVFPLIFRVAIPTFLLAAGVALTLGVPVLWMTVGVALCSVLGWVNRRIWKRQTHLLHALVTVALPWGATVSLLGGFSSAVVASGGSGLAGSSGVAWRYSIALLLLWTLHNWGEGRCLRSPSDRLGMGLMGAADLGIGVLLIVAKAPLWLALLVVLWLPTWLSMYQGRSLQRVAVWWLVAMLISALAVGQSLLQS